VAFLAVLTIPIVLTKTFAFAVSAGTLLLVMHAYLAPTIGKYNLTIDT
jgi:hypothetical protein